MNITCVIASLGPGGAERVLVTLANRWIELGFNISFITYNDAVDDFYCLDPDINRVQLDLFNNTLLFKRLENKVLRLWILRQAIQKTEPDVVISFIHMTNIMVLLATFGMKVPVIVSERNDPDKSQPPIRYKRWQKFAYKRAKYLVLQTQQFSPLFSYIKEKIRIIANPAPLHLPETQITYSREKTVTAVGSLQHQKGFDVLITAFANVAKQHPDWFLNIWGEGPLRAELQELITTLGLTERVFLKGRTKKLFKELTKSGVFVLSSRYEGIPNVMLEALACSCPVIATECNEAVESIITDGENGLTIPPEDVELLSTSIERLITSESERNLFSSRARNSINNLELSSINNLWHELIEVVVK